MENNEAKIDRSFVSIPDNLADSSEDYSTIDFQYFSKAHTWDELLEYQRILITSEAGAGKTFECKQKQQELWNKGNAAFYFELAEVSRCHHLTDLLSYEENERFKCWQNAQSETAFFFLDSIDELKLSQGSFKTALIKLNKAISSNSIRTKLIITTRPTPVDRVLIEKYVPLLPQEYDNKTKLEEFAQIALNKKVTHTEANKTPEIKNVALMPLTIEQIKVLALKHGVSDSDILIQNLNHRNLIEFITRPQDLIEICIDWRDHHKLRTHKEQIDYNIQTKLKPRADRIEVSPLSEKKALEGSRKLAISALLSKKFTFRHNANSDSVHKTNQSLDPASILSDWTHEERIALIERPLFSYASYGRVRFHHRSVMERLAAQYLETMQNENLLSISTIKRLTSGEINNTTLTKTSMRPVLAWLAQSEPIIFDTLLRNEPNLLIDYGDPESFAAVQRRKILEAYIKTYGNGCHLGQYVERAQIERLASVEISKQSFLFLKQEITNSEVRILLLSLIATYPIPECLELVTKIALDIKRDNAERIKAIEILISFHNPLWLEAITKSIEITPKLWPIEIIKYILPDLFPEHISISRLCNILAEIHQYNEDSEPLDLAYIWKYALLNRTEIPDECISKLRQTLTEKIEEKIEFSEKQYPKLQSKRDHLSPILAEICLRVLSSGNNSQEVIASCVTSTSISARNDMDDESNNQLIELIQNSSDKVREAFFWENITFFNKHIANASSYRTYKILNTLGNFSITPKDQEWVIKTLSNKNESHEKRQLLLDVTLSYISAKRDYLMPLINDNSILTSSLKASLVTDEKQKKEHEKSRKKHQRLKQKRDREEANNFKSWILFQKEIITTPEIALNPENRQTTLYNLWQVLRKVNSSHRESEWNRAFIEKHFGKIITEQLRISMSDIWRQMTPAPTLESETSDNKYAVIWHLGITAIYAEAETKDWSEKLSSEEAVLATKFALRERNQLPHWIEDLIKNHPNEVLNILRKELQYQLNLPMDKVHNYVPLLQDISRTSSFVQDKFVPLLLDWLTKHHNRLDQNEKTSDVIDRLHRVLQILLNINNDIVKNKIKAIATKELKSEMRNEFILVWLSTLIKLDPEKGIKKLEYLLKDISPSSDSLGVTWIGLLFDHFHSHKTQTSLNTPDFTPKFLFTLLRLAYIHVKIDDDISHTPNSPYRPGQRDYAQSGRNAILEAFINNTSPEAWKIKMEMLNDPLFSHFQSRAKFLFLQKEAEALDNFTLDDEEIKTFLTLNESALKTHSDMFNLINEKLDMIEGSMFYDDSPRELWATINKETLMRRTFANEFKKYANGIYTVSQEAVTADEKETDIRLESSSANIQGVIELKLGNNSYSAKDLCDTISKQLVTKYMASEQCSSGFLIITLNKNRYWKHPSSNKRIGLKQLQKLLDQEAYRIQQTIGLKRIAVRIFDLRPRLKVEK